MRRDPPRLRLPGRGTPTSARACEEAGITFVGPTPAALALFGDKARARALAAARGVPILTGSDHAVDLDGARAFFEQLGGRPMVIKAILGGGGRGMRAVTAADEIPDAFERCGREARAAFGNGSLFVERFIPRARHIEVQIAGDQHGAVTHIGERECTIQRRYQKLIEMAPSPSISAELRERITQNRSSSPPLADTATSAPSSSSSTPTPTATSRSSRPTRDYRSSTPCRGGHGTRPRGVPDRYRQWPALSELGLSPAPTPRGFAIQARVNLERMREDGEVRPAAGTLRSFRPPAGPGVRVDTYGYAGYSANPNSIR